MDACWSTSVKLQSWNLNRTVDHWLQKTKQLGDFTDKYGFNADNTYMLLKKPSIERIVEEFRLISSNCLTNN